MLTLQQAVDTWLSQHIASTRKSYRYDINTHVKLVGPALPLDAISPVHMATYSDVINQRDYTPRTIRKHVTTIKAFWNWCVRMDFIEKSPARVLRKPKIEEKISREKALPAEDIAILLDYIHRQTTTTSRESYAVAVRDYAIFLFLVETGARVGGVASLKIRDLYLDDLFAHTTEKGTKRLKKPFTKDCAAAFRTWLIVRPQTPFQNDFVFISARYNNPLSQGYISQLMRRYAARIKKDWGHTLQNRNPHSLRHSLAHRMLDEKISPTHVQTTLGHERIETTLRYYAPNDWESAAEASRSLAIKPASPNRLNRGILKLSGE